VVGLLLDEIGAELEIDGTLELRAPIVEPVDTASQRDELAVELTPPFLDPNTVLYFPELGVDKLELSLLHLDRRAGIARTVPDLPERGAFVLDVTELDRVVHTLRLDVEDGEAIDEVADRQGRLDAHGTGQVTPALPVASESIGQEDAASLYANRDVRHRPAASRPLPATQPPRCKEPIPLPSPHVKAPAILYRVLLVPWIPVARAYAAHVPIFKVNDNITTIQQIKVCSINVHGMLTKAEQAELLGDRNIVLKAAPPTHRDRPN
jgi:hypothetical protein